MKDDGEGSNPTAEPEPAAPSEPWVHEGRPADPDLESARHEANPVVRIGRQLGPGIVTGASDVDPSAIGTYVQAGGRLGYAPLWLIVLMLPLMAAMQYTSARIGRVSGRGLAGVLRQHYPRWLLYPVVAVLVGANTFTAGADIGAIAAGIGLIVPLPSIVVVLAVGIGLIVVEVFGSYTWIERTLRWLALALLGYVAAALLAHPDPGAVVAATFVPTIRFDRDFVVLAVAVIGTSVSPYTFFWQASQEVEDQLHIGRVRVWQREGATADELRSTLIDVVSGMLLAAVVSYFIVVAAAATIHASGAQVQTPIDAAAALRPVAGDAAPVLFAAGLIATGLLAVPVLTGSAAYALAEAFNWRYGLDADPRRAPRFYAVIVIGTVVGMAFNVLGVDPIAALVLASVLSGILTPLLCAVLLVVANNRRVMGEHANGWGSNLLGLATTAVMGLAAVVLLVTTAVGGR